MTAGCEGRQRARSARGGRGPNDGIDNVDDHGYSAGGDDGDDRSDSPYDPAIHGDMEEADVTTSTPVRGQPALGGVVGAGARQPPDDAEPMELDLDPDTAVRGDGARSGV